MSFLCTIFGAVIALFASLLCAHNIIKGPVNTAARSLVSVIRAVPYMIWQNLTRFGIAGPREAIKVGDTSADIEEGKTADCWTVGVIMGSSELGLTRSEISALSPEELKNRKTLVRAAYYKAGADYIINDVSELLNVVADINRRLEQNTPRKLLTPGPLTTRYSVKQAMLTDHCTWDDEYKAITTTVMNDITRIAANDDYATVLLQGSGSYAVEAMINCLVPANEKILFLVNGEYGKRMLTIAESSRKNYEHLNFDMTRPVNIEAVRSKLSADSEISTVVFVHSLDLYDQYQGLYAGGGKFRFTSPTNVLLALRQAIDEYRKEGGLPARRARYMENHKVLTQGLEKLGIHSIVAPEYQSYIITTFDLGKLDFPKLYAALKTEGFIIYPGKLTSQPTFRLGNIGDVYPSDMAALVNTIGKYIEAR